MGIKRGRKISELLSYARAISHGLSYNLPQRNRSSEIRKDCYDYLYSMKELQRDAQEYLKDAPVGKKLKDYTEKDYKWDKQNVRDYWIKWEREDVYKAKDSLKRLRKYEKKMKLKPFEEIEEQFKTKTKLERLSSLHGGVEDYGS